MMSRIQRPQLPLTILSKTTVDFMERVCLECQAVIKGRADKKFCDDTCRNNFNNHLMIEDLLYIRKINQILKKNRTILKKINTHGKTNIKTKHLLDMGFDFTYATHYSIINQMSFTFCYEYGYLNLGEEEILLVQKDE